MLETSLAVLIATTDKDNLFPKGGIDRYPMPIFRYFYIEITLFINLNIGAGPPIGFLSENL